MFQLLVTIKYTDTITSMGGGWSTSTGEFTAPAPGRYLFLATLWTLGYQEYNCAAHLMRAVAGGAGTVVVFMYNNYGGNEDGIQ